MDDLVMVPIPVSAEAAALLNSNPDLLAAAGRLLTAFVMASDEDRAAIEAFLRDLPAGTYPAGPVLAPIRAELDAVRLLILRQGVAAGRPRYAG